MSETAPTPADMPAFQEPTPTEDAPREDAPTEDAPQARTPEQYEAELQKLRNEAAKWRTKLRETEPLAKKALEAEEASKTEIQKASERAAKAEQALQERETAHTRLELAVQYSIPPDDIDLIGSGTREEMDRNAKRVAALTKAAATKTPPPPTNRPVEGLRPGATPEPPKPADDSYPSAWAPSYLREDSRSQHGQ